MAQTSFINGMLDTAFSGGTLQMALFKTGTPSTTGVEITGGSYARQTITMSSASGKIKSSTANVAFTGLPTGSANTIAAWGVYKAGTLIDDGLFTTPFTADVSSNELDVGYTFDASGL